MATDTIQTITVPDLGGAENVEVIEILVSVGDELSPEDSIVTLESDKASMEVPSPAGGTVKAINVTLGDKLNEGDNLIELATEDATPEAGTQKEESQSAPAPVPTAVEEQTPSQASNTSSSESIQNSSSQTTAQQEVTIPDIGTEEAEVIEILVQAGDQVAEEDSLLVLESDKASMELPSPFEGKIIAIHLKAGDTIKEGTLAATIETSSSSTSPTPSSESKPELTPENPKHSEPSTETQNAAQAVPSNTSSQVYAGPSVRKLARELEIDLGQVKATGPRGRLQKDDLHAYIKQQLAKAKSGGSSGNAIPAIPDIDYSKFGEFEKEALSKIARVTAENMHRSWLNVPHVTQFDEADLSTLDTLRSSLKPEAEEKGIKLTPLAFLLKASACALKEHPRFNSALCSDGQHIIRKKYIHIGMAVDTPKGLMVPVIRDVDQKDIWDLAKEVIDLSTKAREGKLMPAQLQGGCFTLSSLGAIGGQGFTPIVNTPEVAILGISKAQVKPVWDGENFIPKNMLPLSLSYDHRAINGADAGRFMTYLIEAISNIGEYLK